MRLVKYSAIGIAIAVKLLLLLKSINTMIKFKYLVISAGYLALHGFKVWLYAKEQKDAKVTYYTHSHEHAYVNDEDDWSDDGWKRKLGVGGHDHDVHDVAYARHKPSYAYVRQPDVMY